MEMHGMQDMKLSKAEKKESDGAVMGGGSGPDYPWGLTLNLNEAALAKLGLKNLPDAGGECQIHAIGKVTRVSQSTTAGQKGMRCLEIQITKLSLDMDDGEEAAFSKTLAEGRKRKGR